MAAQLREKHLTLTREIRRYNHNAKYCGLTTAEEALNRAYKREADAMLALILALPGTAIEESAKRGYMKRATAYRDGWQDALSPSHPRRAGECIVTGAAWRTEGASAPSLRERLEAQIERLIAILDALDGHENLEPWLGYNGPGVTDDRKATLRGGEPDVDGAAPRMDHDLE